MWEHWENGRSFRARIVDKPNAWNVADIEEVLNGHLVNSLEAIRKGITLCQDEVLVVEGFLLYCWPSCLQLLDVKLFIDSDEVTCFERYMFLVFNFQKKEEEPVSAVALLSPVGVA